MKIKSFRIKNFKGIADCVIDTGGSSNKIVTLIGLNESGKTTILEAISNFLGEDEDLAQIVGTHNLDDAAKDLIPKHRRANFTGRIEVIATVELETEDRAALEEHFRTKHGVRLKVSALPKEFTINKSRFFKDSEPLKETNYWDITFRGIKDDWGAYKGINSDEGEFGAIWIAAVNMLRDRLPRISYFPTFLFDLPARVYLEDGMDDAEDVAGYYRRILQDVLDSQGSGLKLKEHVVDRIKKNRVNSSGVTTLKSSFEKDTRDDIDHVFRKMSTELNKVILGAWNEIFGKRPKNKRLEVRWGVDPGRGYVPYCEFVMLDGEEKFALKERSLGFRWFFCFLLFTQFGAFRGEKRRIVFLFDEPASNLHSSAQFKLLTSFPKISGAQNTVIYSTHSHYMINPLWLEQAYVVINRSVDYNDASDGDDYFFNRPTDIVSEKYRTFSSQHANQSAYFQPVLDSLDYRTSPLIGDKNCLIVEGKQDYYAMKYFLPALGFKYDVLPGVGAGNMNVLVSLCIGWGRKFLILLDDDVEGRQQKHRYMEEFLLASSQVSTFGDIGKQYKGKALEGLFSEQVKYMVKKALQLTASPKKRDYASFFQERLATTDKLDLVDIDIETKNSFEAIAKFANSHLADF